MKKIMALIPARGGSVRVPGKNTKLLGDKPLIVYTLEAAQQSKLINRIIVSTDSDRIAAVALNAGAEVPFRRPQRISKSNSGELEFYEHAMRWLQNRERYAPDLIVALYPTSPFRSPETIDRAIEALLKHPEADSLRSIRLCAEHPYKMWITNRGYLKPFVKHKNSNVHTLSYQCLPKVYIQNASIYITRPETIIKKRSPVGDKVLPFLMSEIESFDINLPQDFLFAETLLRQMGKQKRHD